MKTLEKTVNNDHSYGGYMVDKEEFDKITKNSEENLKKKGIYRLKLEANSPLDNNQ